MIGSDDEDWEDLVGKRPHIPTMFNNKTNPMQDEEVITTTRRLASPQPSTSKAGEISEPLVTYPNSPSPVPTQPEPTQGLMAANAAWDKTLQEKTWKKPKFGDNEKNSLEEAQEEIEPISSVVSEPEPGEIVDEDDVMQEMITDDIVNTAQAPVPESAEIVNAEIIEEESQVEPMNVDQVDTPNTEKTMDPTFDYIQRSNESPIPEPAESPVKDMLNGAHIESSPPRKDPVEDAEKGSPPVNIMSVPTPPPREDVTSNPIEIFSSQSEDEVQIVESADGAA